MIYHGRVSMYLNSIFSIDCKEESPILFHSDV